MPEERLGEKVGNKLEEGIEQVTANVKDLAAKAGVGSGSHPVKSGREKSSRTVGMAGVRARAATERTKDELYADAARLNIKGRSKMTKAELEKALRRS
ncbi:plasmid stabilization protein [Kribbella sp. NPDC023855]|uniref:plasmid stabilization protein n=1 Tax=Kribbella sp. NPDC023855 TaxID=3154698 RepID=UPI0033D74B56